MLNIVKIGAVARVRNAAAYAVHSFFQQKGYYYVMTPLITTSDCEGIYFNDVAVDVEMICRCW